MYDIQTYTVHIRMCIVYTSVCIYIYIYSYRILSLLVILSTTCIYHIFISRYVSTWAFETETKLFRPGIARRAKRNKITWECWILQIENEESIAAKA